jgi:hypothetical protein
MRRLLASLLLVSGVTVGCGSGDDTAASSTTVTSAPATTVATPTTVAAATSSSRPPAGAITTTARLTAATAVIEPHQVAGIGLGANKSQAIAVLGPPTRTGQETDLSGKKYDYLAWDLAGDRGLVLAFGTDSVTSPLLTDWKATAAGPRTTGGVQVGDTSAKTAAAHGALTAFCCDTKVASVTQAGGRMIVIVGNASQRVDQIVGGDPAYWSRKIAD